MRVVKTDGDTVVWRVPSDSDASTVYLTGVNIYTSECSCTCRDHEFRHGNQPTKASLNGTQHCKHAKAVGAQMGLV